MGTVLPNQKCFCKDFYKSSSIIRPCYRHSLNYTPMLPPLSQLYAHVTATLSRFASAFDSLEFFPDYEQSSKD